ncbi:hypothetical protein JZ751_004750 [Albula glossodonta]|uniref:Sodium channel regulatory subunit beta-3 n=1 Tax=Albula glossodonta TaxID=121402 RepID=A0A8T2NCC7_9TELE|nr:hypothetical protein JZ751_004750 [Albula glossodonta]
MTEAVAGESFLLGCISCKKREEVSASTTVDWFFKPEGEDNFTQFNGRLKWEGTDSSDVQIGAIMIHNVTFNDTGTYRCTFERVLDVPHERDTEHVTINKDVELSVVAVANRELTAVISEIMMYVLIVGLQLWMIGVLIYCYKKVYAEREAYEARRAMRHPSLLRDSKDKDNCDGVHLE